MDEFSSKRTVNGLVGPRRGLRDTTDNKDKNVQYCNRLGCNGRLNCTKSTRIGNMEKTRPLRPAFGSSNGKEVVASSSSARRPCKESRKSFYNVENKLPREEPKVIKQTEPKVVSKEASSSSGTTMSGRPRKPFCHKFGSGSGSASASSNQKSPMDSSVSVSSKAVSIGTRSGSSSSNGEGYGLRNLKCSSLSEGHPYSSLSESRISRRDAIKRRNLEGEGSSSSSKGKKMGGALPNLSGISISDSRSRRNTDVGEGNRAVSVRTRRSMNVNTRLSGDSVQESLQTRPSGLSQKFPRPETPTLDMPSSSGQFFTDSSSSDYSLPGNEGDDDDDDDVSINGFVNRDVLQGYNMDGVAQVLLALERIEQDEEMTYERLLALETNLFLSGLNLYDQHRDMRLDIDDMSYEELLALEEKIGSVCTALPEEALSKCLTRSIYEGIPCKTETVEADSKCSVCQEEYMIGDEIGKLGCEHGYHMECIKQWFNMKNWCPICKTSAAGPPES